MKRIDNSMKLRAALYFGIIYIYNIHSRFKGQYLLLLQDDQSIAQPCYRFALMNMPPPHYSSIDWHDESTHHLCLLTKNYWCLFRLIN